MLKYKYNTHTNTALPIHRNDTKKNIYFLDWLICKTLKNVFFNAKTHSREKEPT